MTPLILVSFLCLAAAPVGSLAATAGYQPTMISSGDNFPAIDIGKSPYTEICAELHHGVSAAEIARRLSLAEADVNRRIAELRAAGLVASSGGVDRPTFMVVDRADGAWLSGLAPTLVDETVNAIAGRKRAFDAAFARIPALAAVDRGADSLLLYSDVLLDNWQIQTFESSFLKAERPLRAGKRYYYAMLERDSGEDTETFGIYGNATRAAGELALGLYGNRRDTYPARLLTRRILAAYAAFVRSGAPLDDGARSALETAGWLRANRPLAPVIAAADDKALAGIAAGFAPVLLAALEAHRGELESDYRGSHYANEVTFAEFAIWWYHFFYTNVTNRLVARGLIAPPALGVVPYLIEDS